MACASPEYDDSDWDTLTVPGLWSGKTGALFGYCWLRLKIINIKDISLACYLVNAWTSYELYVNGELLQKNGIPGKTREQTIPCSTPEYSLLNKDNESIVFAWKIANFVHQNGGPKYPLKIGLAKTIIRSFWIEYIFILFLVGSILMMGIYHCILWFSYTKEKAHLYFFLFCMIMVLRLVTINRIPNLFFPSVFSFPLVSKIEQLTMPFGYLLFVLFIKELFPQEMFHTTLLPKKFPRYFYYVTSAIHILFALFSIISPLWISLYTHLYYQILFILGGFWVLYSVIKAAFRKKTGATILLGGFILIFLTVILDIIFSKLPGVEPDLFLFGMLFFILANSTVLSIRFSNALKTSEYLSKNLQEDIYMILSDIPPAIQDLKNKPGHTATAGKSTILIVEDNIDMLTFLKETFDPMYTVHCAMDGAGALEILANQKTIHLILSDIMMDVMDGYEFYGKVKENDSFSSIPFIFLTAKSNHLEKLKALKQGVVDFIQKPFNAEELLAKVDALITLQKRQRKELVNTLFQSLYKKQAEESIKDLFAMFFKKKCAEFDISPRETDILLLLIDGKKYKEIAESLYISENTVRTHVHHIYEKCDVSNKTELAQVFKMN